MSDLTEALARYDKGDWSSADDPIVFGAARRWAELEAPLEALRQAIEDKGSMPVYHDRVLTRHRKEWPTLWRAIDALLGEGATE